MSTRIGVDAIVHVGTHGNLEFLPGKGTGLSRNCYPDIGIGHIPHLYIYNADNPPEGTIAKHQQEEGRMPENVAICWMCNDIMWADGEGMSQIFSLLGVRPVWRPNGRVKGFEIIPLDILGRPRVDVTIRVSGITRDNFPHCVEVDDWIFDDIAKTFVLDSENREFFQEHNPWALEEVGRRLLEAQSRGLWQADPDVLDQLKERYLEIEGWIEDRMGDVTGDFQGGAVDIVTAEDVGNWGEMMREVKDKLKAVTQQ